MLSQARNTLPGTHHYWYTSEDLCIAGEWKHAWDNFTKGLEMGRIRLSTQPNSLVWVHDRSVGTISSKTVYDYIVQSSQPPTGNSLQALIWSGTLPTKNSCFIWLVLENKILTWDNL